MPITISNLNSIEAEIARFLEKLGQCRVAMKRAGLGEDQTMITGSKETGAVRRASLDLSRALADLRKS